MADRNTRGANSRTPDPPPLTPAGFQVLVALAAGKGHGYAVMQFVEEVTAGSITLGPGTLYRTIARLVADGLVEEIPHGDPGAPHDPRRRYYDVTPLGRTAARREAMLMVRLIEIASGAGLLDPARRDTA
jgi:DNA-binding PadR family transcriptional regulator